MVKPTKMRNRQIYKATQTLLSKNTSANLAKRLRKKYKRRSIRIVEGDSVLIKRGEYADVTGKVEKVDVSSGRISVSDTKKEKAKGDKFDVMIHASNVIVTGLNLKDPKRRAKIGAIDEYEADDEKESGRVGVTLSDDMDEQIDQNTTAGEQTDSKDEDSDELYDSLVGDDDDDDEGLTEDEEDEDEDDDGYADVDYYDTEDEDEEDVKNNTDQDDNDKRVQADKTESNSQRSTS